MASGRRPAARRGSARRGAERSGAERSGAASGADRSESGAAAKCLESAREDERRRVRPNVADAARASPREEPGRPERSRRT